MAVRLEAATTHVFSQYGLVFVKIKRDMKNNVPFQYTVSYLFVTIH
jgi:hypothetical protein